MKKVVCFCRVSSKVQDLETQKKEVLKAIKADGYKSSEVVVVEGKESAIKLDEMERQTLNELKQVIAENDTIETIYFYAIDRLARKVSIVLSIVDQMIKEGINIKFLNPYPLQTLRNGKVDAMGKMFLTFVSIGAEMEMEIKKARFEDKRSQMKSEGKLLTGKVLYGYYRDSNGYPQKKDDEANIVIEIFNEYVYGGKSMREIAKDLTFRGVFNNPKIQSNLVKISHIITNPAYSGRQAKQYDSKEEKNIKYPQIVSEELQDKAMKLSSSYSRIKDTKNIYYCKGLVKIQNGDKWFSMFPLKGNASYCYKDDNSKQTNVSINVLDTIALFEAQGIYKIYDKYERFLEPSSIKAEIDNMIDRMNNIVPIFDKFKERENRINKMYELGRYTDEQYNNAWNDLLNERKVYDDEMTKCQNEIKRLKMKLNKHQENRFAETELVLETDADKRDLCLKMIDHIEVVKTSKYEYQIIVIPTTDLRIGIATWTWIYNVSGGKIRLNRVSERHNIDFSDQIIKRYETPKRGNKKKVVD